MATKLDRIVTYLDGLLLIYSPDRLIKMVLSDHLTSSKYYISTTTIPMVTKRSKIVTHHKVHPLKR